MGFTAAVLREDTSQATVTRLKEMWAGRCRQGSVIFRSEDCPHKETHFF